MIVNNKRKQSPYKPGSVPDTKSGVCHLSRTQCASSVLPSIGVSRTGRPQTMVYANLQPPAGTARRSPVVWWSLTPPSHPYPSWRQAVVFFCLHPPSPMASIFGSGVPFAARTFLFHSKWQRQTEILLSAAKLLQVARNTKWFLTFLLNVVGNVPKSYINMNVLLHE